MGTVSNRRTLREQIYSLPRLASSLPIHFLSFCIVLIYSTIKENKMQYYFFIFLFFLKIPFSQQFFPYIYACVYTCTYAHIIYNDNYFRIIPISKYFIPFLFNSLTISVLIILDISKYSKGSVWQTILTL